MFTVDYYRLIRFVSRFTVHLCNAIYFSIIFNTPCSARWPCNFLNALAKIDLVKKTVENWHDQDGAAAPSEPLFVARPGATSEDDGQFI